VKRFPGAALLAGVACSLTSLCLAQVTHWTSVGIGGGGALYAPNFNPANPEELYVGCDMSGLYHSINAGVSWDVLPFTSIEGGHFADVQFTSDPDIRYAVNYRNDAMTPVRSNDGGQTWTALPGDPTYGGVWQLVVDPNTTNRLMITDYRNLYLSTDGGISFSSPKYSVPSPGSCYIAGGFFCDDSIYLGTNLGLLGSTNGGDTFIKTPCSGIPSNQGLLSFAGANSGGTIRFFGVAADTNDIYVGIFGSDYWNICKGIYTFDLGQSSWAQHTSGIQLGTDFPFFVAMARNDINTAYVAGGSSSGNPTMFKTTNAGDTWVETFHYAGNQNIYTGWSGSGGDRGWGYGECAMGFGVAPLNPNIAAFSDYGFVHVTYDGGDTWRQCYVSPSTQNPPGHNITPGSYYQGVGLENTSCWDVLWLNRDSLFVGFADINGIRSTDAGIRWSIIPNLTLNSVYSLVEHPVTRVLYAAIASVHDLYQSTRLVDSRIDAGNGNVKFSTDRGASWSTLHNFAKPVIWVALDPNRPNRMYVAVVNYTNHLGGIWRTDDLQDGASSAWVQCSAPTRTQGHPLNVRVLNDGAVVTSWSGRIDSTGHFTASSGVFVSTDSGLTWTDRSTSGLDYWTMDVVIDPYDSLQNTWYACVFSGWGGPPNGLGGLYRTTNRGIAWTRINNLDRVGSCTISPANPDEMYLTTEVDGLWYTSDLSSPTPTFGLVASYPFRHPERVFYSPYDTGQLWVTSFGGGLRIGDNLSGITAPGPRPPTPDPCLAFPSLCRLTTGVRFNLNSPAPATLSIHDITGRLVRSFGIPRPQTPDPRTHPLAPSLTRSLRWNCQDQSGRLVPSGIYLVRLQGTDVNSHAKLLLLP
jgi:hypothetical protein